MSSRKVETQGRASHKVIKLSVAKSREFGIEIHGRASHKVYQV